MTARAGLADAREFSLRELVWRADALRSDAWDHTAWLALHAIAPWSKRARLSDVHPLLVKADGAARAVTRGWREEMLAAGALRKARTPEEKERAWQEFCRRQDETEALDV